MTKFFAIDTGNPALIDAGGIAFGTDAKAAAIFDELRTFANPKKRAKAAQDEAK